MVFDHILLPRAQVEIKEAVLFYNSRKDELGLQFLEEITVSINRILINPLLFKKGFQDFHEAPLNLFPFILIYKVLDNRIVFFSCFHTSRNPLNKPV